jgi:hypothetical protein
MSLLPFPEEERRAADLRSALDRPFDLADAIYNSWLTYEKDKWLRQSALPYESLTLAMLLNVQACRLYRSVVDMCRRGEALSTNILARTLFETVLGQQFLLARRVPVTVEPKREKGGGVKLTPAGTPDYVAKPSSKVGTASRMPRELRAKIYLAHSYFQFDREITAVECFPGGKRSAKRLRKGIHPRLTAEYERAIGPEWGHILRHQPHTYSGLKVEPLAKVLHRALHSWYKTIYRSQSRAVHANDLMRLMDVSDGMTIKPAYFSETRNVYEVLRATMGLMMISISILHFNIGFGPELDTTYASLKRQLDALSGFDYQV